MPSPREAASSMNMPSFTASAIACGSCCFLSSMESGSRVTLARDQRRRPIALLTVVFAQVRERACKHREPHLLRPLHGTARVVDAIAHGHIDRFGAADAIGHGVGSLVDQHG